jgi:hypothetical protein
MANFVINYVESSGSVAVLVLVKVAGFRSVYKIPSILEHERRATCKKLRLRLEVSYL